MKTIQRGKIMSKKQIHEIEELGTKDTKEKINEKKDMLLISHYDDNLQKYVSRSISYDDFQVNLRNIITQLNDKISNINSSMLDQINDLISRVVELENNSGGTVIGTVALTNAAFPSHTYTFPCDGMVTFEFHGTVVVGGTSYTYTEKSTSGSTKSGTSHTTYLYSLKSLNVTKDSTIDWSRCVVSTYSPPSGDMFKSAYFYPGGKI